MNPLDLAHSTMQTDGQEKISPRRKRRRLPNACDTCRRQKAGNICSNCIAFGSECTHTDRASSKAGGSSASSKQDLNLHSRTAQDHVAHILGGSNEYVSSDPLVVYHVLVAVAQYARRLEEVLTSPSVVSQSANSPSVPHPPDDTEDSDSDDGLLVDSSLPKSLQQITRDISFNRFYGRSSSIHFIRDFLVAKIEATGDSNLIRQRPEFWNLRDWDVPMEIFVPQIFPPPQLLNSLVDLYFTEINILIYVLHENTFRRSLAAGLHLHDQKFGALVLSVCALGAKFSDDPRVFMEHSEFEHTAGLKWFRQVRPVPRSLYVSPTLYELQVVLMSILYLASASTPEETYALVGLGLRMAYDLGAHSRIRATHEGGNVEAELYKRVFLVLLCSDLIMSALLGRPRTTNFNDLDLDPPMPLEGETPILAVYATRLTKLMEIWNKLQEELYPPKRKDQNASYQEIVAQLDSQLNSWADSVPDELKWDPNRKDLTSLNQSACLYATYYHALILLHRPFIPLPNQSSLSSISFPSLAISASAARSCAHVMDVQTKRGRGPLFNPQMISAIVDSALVLLMNVFHRSRTTADQSVQKCLDVLKVYESRWQIAGRNADILAGMLEGVLNDKEVSTTPSLKRHRSSEDIGPSKDSNDTPDSNYVAAVTQDIEQMQVSQSPGQAIEQLLSLPFSSKELGVLPIYEPLDFGLIFHPDPFPGPVDAVELGDPLAFAAAELNVPFENWNDWTAYEPGPSNLR
ncbi:fungal-trans domain-containing protein [Favolaschia claudopus]|uniref:Fungal-trans domain-containing protein n=1 Tax=Favolaschia claudopus TaxID=2862362 RepID=A0AAW0EDL3_9AGAR